MKPSEIRAFLEYCWSFYGPCEIYGRIFHHKLNKQQLFTAVMLRIRCAGENFAGDSVDREAVRDILLTALQLGK